MHKKRHEETIAADVRSAAGGEGQEGHGGMPSASCHGRTGGSAPASHIQPRHALSLSTHLHPAQRASAS